MEQKYYWIIVVLGLVISGCVQEIKTPDTSKSLKENEILIKDYSYTFKKDTSSHQIRGIWESLSFKHQNIEFTLKSEQTHPGPSYGQTSFEYNFSDNKPINLYNPGEEIPDKCEGDIQTPDDFYSYGLVEMSCSSELKLIILDTKTFDLCLINQSCTLTYGEEIEIVNE